jgi:hypothetical protein
MFSLDRIHAITSGVPENIRAAFAGPEMRGVLPILNKIEAGIGGNFPMTIAELDRQLSGAGLKTAERIALKAAMSRAGLLK